MVWEYLEVLIGGHDFNALGGAGWELVVVNNGVAYFKREKEVIGIYDTSEVLNRWGIRTTRKEMDID